MSWQQLIVRTTEQFSDNISDILSENGSVAVTIQDAEDQPIFEPLPDTMPLWSELLVTGLFSANKNLTSTIEQVRAEVGQETHCKVEILEDKDWVRSWMDDFKPMQFGKKLWICPSWDEPIDENAVNISLDPGLAFGTGTHPTTALCLRWLDEYSEKNSLQKQEFIDYGCGSGILSIAALMLGAKLVYAVDIDSQAIQATTDNAIKNHQQDNLHCFLPKQFNQQLSNLQTDVLMANILCGPLLELGEFFAGKVKHGGSIVLSGILLEQADKIRSHYQQWFKLDATEQEGDWVRISGKKIV